MPRPSSALVLVLVLVACAPPRLAASPGNRPGVAASREAADVRGSPLPAAPATVPPPPQECAAFPAHASAPTPTCDSSSAENALDAALGNGPDGAVDRDARLAQLETCSAFAPGLIRALRMELAPPACGDALAVQFFAAEPASVRSDVEQVIVGLGLAARLSRLVRNAPKLEPPFDKAKFLEFFARELKPWMVVQAQAIHDISAAGSRLAGYGRAVVAVEAGLADMRFVEATRAVPLPDEMARDAEVRDQYYMVLDESLEPRKTRGRDAALAGLKGFEQAGVLASPRVAEARRLLSELYGGRRIDALDRLMVPALPAFDPSSVRERLAQKLPTYYAGIVLANHDPSDPRLLRALLAQGIPGAVRANFASSTPPAETRAIWARALFELGRTYWSAEDFRAAHRAAQDPAGASSSGNDGGALRLVSALSSVLEGGPADAAQMMLRGPFIPSDVGNTSAVDRIASEQAGISGLAGFDSAYLRSLVPPVEPNPDFWRHLADDYRRAARILVEPAARTEANERAKAADDTAKALSGTSHAH